MNLTQVADKALKMIDSQLEAIESNRTSVTNIHDQIKIATDLAAIVQVLNKVATLQEAIDGQTKTQENQTTNQKKETLEDVFSNE